MSSWRFRVLQIWFFLFGFLIILRLFYWQVIAAEKLQAMAQMQHFSLQEIPAKRGEIIASDGFPLATSKQSFLVFANLSQLGQSSSEIASLLAPALNSQELQETEKELKSRLERQELSWVSLARKVDRQTKELIENLKIAGLGFEEEEKRFYPEGSMSAQMLGFVGQDTSGKDKGYFGLEGYYDRTLTGKSGFLLQEKDASGKPILIGHTSFEGEVVGRDLVLHLNRGLQFMLEEKLKKGMEKYQSKEALAMIMEPKTGAVLAMASFPNFDPVSYAQTEKQLFSNPVVSQTFEPGSIFKPMVMAAAIEENLVKPDDRCLKCEGPRQIGEYTIKTWDEQYHPNSTMTEILEHSDNVGMVYVSEKLGGAKMIEYLKKFGFDRQTEIDLEGETVAPFRREQDWGMIDLATVSFGQGVAVTPIQMVRSIAALANGGELVEPHVVWKIKTKEKEIEIKPKIQGRVISQGTAKILTEMMVSSVERGGKWERPKGYRIAGKTGTAQIPIAGHYDKEKTIVSFVGFAPADNPRFVMLVTLREPALIWGSRTVAPLWFEIAKEVFYLLNIPPNF